MLKIKESLLRNKALAVATGIATLLGMQLVHPIYETETMRSARMAAEAAATPTRTIDFAAVCTPELKAQALWQTMAAAQPGELVPVPAGIYTGSGWPTTPAGVTIKGDGPGRTILQSPDYYTDANAVSFDLGHQSIVDSLTMESTAAMNRQSITTGVGKKSETPREATIRNCEVKNGCWGIYSWQPGTKLTVENCTVIAARVGITAGNSGVGQTFTLTNNRVKLDARLNSQGGSVTHPDWGGQFAILSRGGYTKISGLDVEILGPPVDTGPRVVAITDWHDPNSSSSTVIEYEKVRTKLTQGGAKSKWDIDVRYGMIRPLGSSGSGPRGSVTQCLDAKPPQPAVKAAAPEREPAQPIGGIDRET